MARDHARISVHVWADQDWCSLTVEAQHLYWLLLAQPNTTHCGSLPYTPRRWQHMAVGMDVEPAFHELVARRYVLLDETTDELLIRTFMRNDGVLAQPNVTRSAITAADALMSANLKHQLADELLSHQDDLTKLKGWEIAEAWAKANWNPSANPSANPSDKAYLGASEDAVPGEETRRDGDATAAEPPTEKAQVTDLSNPSRNPSGNPSDSPAPSPTPPNGGDGRAVDSPTLTDEFPLKPTSGSYSAAVAEWAARNGDPPPRDSKRRSESYRWVLEQVIVNLPRTTDAQQQRFRGRCGQVIADYLAEMWERPLAHAEWLMLKGLVKEFSPRDVLDGCAIAIEQGAGLAGVHADEPLSFLRYAKSVCVTRSRERAA